MWTKLLSLLLLGVRAEWGPIACWDKPECFELKPGESGFLKRGGQIRPFGFTNGTKPLITDAYWGLPAFYVRDHLEGREKWDLRGVPTRVFEMFASLPVRSHESPYLLFFKPTFCGWNWTCPDVIENLVRNRTDIIWIGHDLTGMKLTYPGHALPGITIPAELGSTLFHAWRFRGQRKEKHKYLLTFQGKCPSTPHAREWYTNYSLRGEMNGLFNIVNSQNFGNTQRPGLPPGVSFTCIEKQRGRLSNTDQYDELLDSTFGLVPKGDERWSFRFLETVGAGAIPVIVADGLTLPFENLVDWEQIVVRVPEADVLKMESFKDLLAVLPQDPQEIERRQKLLVEANDKWFKDGDTIKNTFRESLRKYIVEKARLNHVQIDYNTYVPPAEPVPMKRYLDASQKNPTKTSLREGKAVPSSPLARNLEEVPYVTTLFERLRSFTSSGAEAPASSAHLLHETRKGDVLLFNLPKDLGTPVDFADSKRRFSSFFEVESVVVILVCVAFFACATLSRGAHKAVRKTKI